MPFQIVRNDITAMRVDAIVNTANPRPVIGQGTDSAVHAKAGPRLLEARQRIGCIAPGDAAITPAGDLDARFVIHTVGPVWQGGGQGEEALLRSCYDRSLALALAHGCGSVAFPLICAGNYGFPRDRALQIAIAAFSSFLPEHEMQIYLVVYDRDSYRLSEKLFQGIASYIDEQYVQSHAAADCAPAPQKRILAERRREVPRCGGGGPWMETMPCAAKSLSLEEMLRQADAGFTETLLKRIDASSMTDAQVYKRANISKQHFSKIRNNPQYRPTKATALAFAIALELDLEQTRDLIGRAGYALTNSSKFDLIIRYFIEQGIYNVVQINCALFEHDQSLLGG